MAKDKILLIDFNNFAHIAGSGFKEGNYYLIYNFFKNLRALVETFYPDKIFFALEGRPEFRYQLFADYKGNRIKIAEDVAKAPEKRPFYPQLNEIIRLLKYLPVTLIRASKYEADDVIATLCEDLKDETIIIVSTDGDYIQLLQKDYKDISIFNPIKKGFMPCPSYYYLCYKALIGDRSDNIPRVCSMKMAYACNNNPEKLKEIFKNPEKKSRFNINRKLMEMVIITDDELIVQESNPNFTLLKAEFNMMEFNSITNDMSWDKFQRTFGHLTL